MAIKRITNSDVLENGSSGSAISLHRETVIVITVPDIGDECITLERIGNYIRLYVSPGLVLDPSDADEVASQLQQIAHGAGL